MAQLFDSVFMDSQSVLLIRFFVDASIKGSVLLLIASGLTFAFRRASASARHLVWSLSLASLLALPLLTLLLPAWQVAAFSRVIPAEDASTPAASITAPEYLSAPALEPFESPGGASLGGMEGISPEGPKSPKSPESHATAQLKAESAGPASFRLPVWLLLIWLSGAAMILARLLVGTGSVRRIARNAERVTDPSRLSMVRTISWQLGLAREVELLVSERISMPLTFGSLRSVVLLPSEAIRWDDERLQIVLLHELAHVKRKDCFTQLIAHLSCALYWFNPLIWLALRELRIERERACDDYVLDTGTKASDYASHLLDIARSLGAAECSSFATVAIARRSQLEGRLLAILDPSLSRKGLKRMSKLIIALALISVILPLAALRPKAHAREVMGEAAAEQSAESGAVQRAAAPAIPSFARDSALSSKALPEGLPPEHQPGTPPEPPISVEAEPEAGAAQDNEQDSKQEGQEDRSGIAEAFNEALKDTDAEVRRNALMALARMQDPRAVDGLVEALKDSNPAMRESAIQGLATIQDARAAEALIAALKDPSAQVREKAAWALGLKSDRRVVEPLVAALGDPQPEVRHKAAWALGLQGDARAVDPLIATLRDENAGVREVSAWALGLRGDRRAESALEAATKDPNKEVSQKAFWALGLLMIREGRGTAGAVPNSDNDPNSPEVKMKMKMNMASKVNIKLKNVSKTKN